MREIRDLLYNSEQTGMLIDEMASFIYTPGQLSWVDADRAMWDYNPIMTSSYVNSSKAGVGDITPAAAGDLPSNEFRRHDSVDEKLHHLARRLDRQHYTHRQCANPQ